MEKVETVKGPISPNALGITLPHEHLLVDLGFVFQEPEMASEKWIVDAPISIENLEMFKKSRTISKDNLHLTNIEMVINELKEFKYYGGHSLVEVTPIGCGRDPLGLRKISEETEINVLCSTGWYTAISHPEYIKTKSIDELRSIMVSELTEGIGTYTIKEGSQGANEMQMSNVLIENLKIKAGLIKCACSNPLHPNEIKVLQAAAQAQKEVDVHFSIHPSSPSIASKPVETILDIITEEGVNLEKTSICHTDAFLFDGKVWDLSLDYHTSIMDAYNVTLNFDTFGKNQYYDFPAVFRDDRKRIAAVVELCNQGYDKQILLSQDICFKVHLKAYGGLGYAQILKYIVPELKYHGVTDKQINNLLIENAKRLLAY